MILLALFQRNFLSIRVNTIINNQEFYCDKGRIDREIIFGSFLSQYEGYSAEIHEIYPNEFDINQNIFVFT